MRIVITGAKGFIGGHLLRQLQKAGHEITSWVRSEVNLSDIESVQNAFRQTNPEILIHLASKVSPGREINDFEAQFKDTVLPAYNLAKAVPENIKLALFFGTCEEYGNGPVPFHEDQRLISFSTYGWAKISAFQAISLICNQRKIPWIYPRPFLTFGEGQNQNLLFPALVKACVRNEELPLTTGEQTRDFIYVGDLVRMVQRIIENPKPLLGKAVNLSTNYPRRVYDVGEIIRKVAGGGRLLWGKLPYRDNEAMQFYGDNRRYLETYGPFEFTPFEEAVKRTIAAAEVEFSASQQQI